MERLRRGRPVRGRLARIAVAAAIALTAVGLSGAPAHALDTANTPTAVTGNATWFAGLGSPYGGCGLPQDAIETQNFIALNVYNTPNDYSFYPRPLTGANLSKMGMWNNGLNCGRWVRVTVSDYCTGQNDGAPGQPFCRNGSWVSDQYNGATLDMLVTDSCGDSNAWCRDDPYHIDLMQSSLNEFSLNGTKVSGLSNKWNNRHLSWQFIPAPNYSGDLKIGFIQNAFNWWPAIAVTNLPNGIHGVEYLAPGGVWTAATMNGDMGQSYVIAPTVSGGTEFQIRVKDITDGYVNGGRVYSFSLPAACSSRCPNAFNQVTYTTSGGTSSTTTTTTRPTTSTTTTTTQPTTTTTTQPTTTTTRPTTTTTTTPPTTTTTTTTTTRPTTTTTTRPPTTTTTTTTPPTTTTTRPTTTTTGGGGGCTATYSVVGSWPGGFQGQVVITAGAPINSWTASWTLAGGQSINQAWGATLTTSGGSVTATNAAWNGTLGTGASATLGFIGSAGSSNPVPAVTCTAR